jgi:O-antigen/teichoic acid export membrane protein
MQRRFLTNLVLLISLNFLVKPLWIFGIDRNVQNLVGPESFGFYFTIFNFAFIFNILLDAGITNFNNRNIAQHHHLLNKHFSGIVTLRFMLALLYVVVIYAVALILGYNSAQLKLLAWVALNQFLLTFILYLRSNISGLLMFKTDSVMSVLDRLLMIGICAVLLWGHISGFQFTIEWFVYAQTMAYSLTALVALIIVIRKSKFRKFTWNIPFFLMILKQSFPYAVLALLMSMYNRVDSVFIERLLGESLGNQQSGVYAQAFRLLDAANQFALLFGVLLLPIYSRMLKQKQPLNQMIKLPYSILITVGIIAAVGSYYYRSEIMHLLYTQSSNETLAQYTVRIGQSASIYGTLMFCFLGTSTMYVFSTLLTANGNLKQLNIIATAGIVINFSLNLLLVPRMLALGSAYASLAAQLATAIAQVAVVQYYFRFRINYRFITNLLIFAAGVVLINYFSKLLPVKWLFSFLIMVFGSLLLASLMRLISIRSFISILRQKEA